MFSLRLCVLVTQLLVGTACAQDDAVTDARRLFEEGVNAGASKDWELAVQRFEASLQEAEHPAARFNLVLAYAELRRNLDVVRHAWVFLDLPETESRPEARVQVRELLEKATRTLAVLNTERVANEAKLRVDGRPPQVTHGTLVYLPPGSHTLETQRPGQAAAYAVTLSLVAGYFGHWPELPENAAAVAQPRSLVVAKAPVAPPLVPAPSSWRYRAAWAVGNLGAVTGVAAVALYAATKLRAEELEHADWSEAGYIDEADRYGRLKLSVAPMALGSGLLMAGALLLGPRIAQSGSLAWGVAALASGVAMVGLGAVWLAHEPRTLIKGVEDVTSPVHQAGYLWIAASLPLIAYGLTVVIARARQRTMTADSALPLRMRW